MVRYDNCQNSYHNERLSCMGAKASQPTHFLKVRLTGVRLSEIHCISLMDVMIMIMKDGSPFTKVYHKPIHMNSIPLVLLPPPHGPHCAHLTQETGFPLFLSDVRRKVICCPPSEWLPGAFPFSSVLTIQ